MQIQFFALDVFYLTYGTIAGLTALGLSWMFYKKFRFFEASVLLFFFQTLCLGGWDWWVTTILRDPHNEQQCLAALWGGTALGALIGWVAFKKHTTHRRKR